MSKSDQNKTSALAELKAGEPKTPKPVRIKSTRQSQVTFPEVNKGPEAKEAGLPYFIAQPIAPATEVDGKLAGTVTVLDGRYWHYVKKNKMVMTFFDPGGGMEVVKGTGDAGSGFPQSLLGRSDGAAQTYIHECDDKAVIIGWLRDLPSGDMHDAALAKLDVLDGHAARGTSKEGPSPAV